MNSNTKFTHNIYFFTQTASAASAKYLMSDPKHGLVTVVRCGGPDQGTTGEVTTGEVVVTTGEEITDTENEK